MSTQGADIEPLVSCMMPTRDRPEFVPHAIEYFQRQTYTHAELIIVDDGSECVADLVPPDRRVRYYRLQQRASLGSKRNFACERARGSLIAHWDDDDWYAPWRLEYQVSALANSPTSVCGIQSPVFHDLRAMESWQYVYPTEWRAWVAGATLCYRLQFWQSHRFPDVDVGEDGYFVWSARPDEVLCLPDESFFVAMIHDSNTSPKAVGGPYWRPYPLAEVRRRLASDWGVYHPKPAELQAPISDGRQVLPMLTTARQLDLSLPEFAAFNAGVSLPWMRRWELPFALFQARLRDGMSVLDCTINPAGFEERLRRLYPHTLYRHCSPIQHNQFAVPSGVPDGVFDRVICVNTLEHLLAEQRDQLIGSIARKLKPGGKLILTSDYYFDSFWRDPAFLNTGVMRPDRADVFNGWNKLRVLDWLQLCGQHGLELLGDLIDEPSEADVGLFRNLPPFPHACIGGVFAKPPLATHDLRTSVLLAILSWNTCQPSIEAIRALIREGRLLQRLGQSVTLCICDNGSDDGTLDAIHALEPEIDLPHVLIVNQENHGSSRARNQIIDCMLDRGSDYVLFTDGDIETVPFSTFAMLRYAESHGSEIGCIGADSAGQTPLRSNASATWYSIDDASVETTNLVAWTQYGLFRRRVFEDGVRFDESGPFSGPGWGFEDNDLAFQMELKGYLSQRFFGMVYLHRNIRSSVQNMLRQGLDPGALYARRKQYIMDKWANTPRIDNGPLEYIRRVDLQL